MLRRTHSSLILALMIATAMIPEMLWAQGEIIWALRGMPLQRSDNVADVNSLQLNDDGSEVCVRTRQGILTWSLKTSKLLRTMGGFRSVDGQSIASDGRTAAMFIVSTHQLVLVDLMSKSIIDTVTSDYTLANDNLPGTSAFFSGDGTKLLVVSPTVAYNYLTRAMFDVASRRFIWRDTVQPIQGPFSLSHDGRYFVVAGKYSVYSGENGRIIRDLERAGGSVDGAFFANGDSVLMGSTASEIIAWDVLTGKRIAAVRKAPMHGAGLLVRSNLDGRMLLVNRSGERDSTVRVYDLGSGAMRSFALLEAAFPLYSATCSRDGRELIVLTSTARILCYDIATGKLTRSLVDGLANSFGLVRMVSSADRLVVCGNDFTVRQYRARTGELVSNHVCDGIPVAISRDGATWIQRRNVPDSTIFELRSVASGSLISVLATVPSGWNTCAATPDGRHIAVAYHSIINLIDGRTGHVEMNYGASNVSLLRFSPDGAHFASLTRFGTGDYWSTTSGARKGGVAIKAHDVSFSPDSKLMVWTTPGGVAIQDLDGSLRALPVTTNCDWAVISPDNKWVIGSGRGWGGSAATTNLFAIDAATGEVEHSYRDPLDYLYSHYHLTADDISQTFVTTSTNGDIIRWRFLGNVEGSSGISDNDGVGAARLTVSTAADAVSMTTNLDASATFSADLYDALGARVGTIDLHDVPAGTHSEVLRTRGLPPGAYFMRVAIDGAVTVRSVAIVR